ncbi:hypothetical protein D3C72_2296270 [compost metagenome]
MPVSTAPKFGIRAIGFSISPIITSRLVMPAVRENSVDQAKPMMTSERERIDKSATSHST